MIKFNKKEYIPFYIISGLIFLSFLFSLITFSVKKTGTRKCFIFPSADSGKYVVEYRNLSSKAPQGKLNYFIDELLLGSTVERTKKLFATGTRVESCFLRDDTLYLNLSEELLNPDKSEVPIQEGVELLELNVKKNFYKVKNVVLFVNGNLAYDFSN